MLQDALGHSWRHLVRSWTLWDASGSLQDTLGGLKHYACSVFVASGCLQDAPGRSNITPVVFFGTAGVSSAGSSRLAGPHQDVFFLLFFII